MVSSFFNFQPFHLFFSAGGDFDDLADLKFVAGGVVHGHELLHGGLVASGKFPIAVAGLHGVGLDAGGGALSLRGAFRRGHHGRDAGRDRGGRRGAGDGGSFG